ncbi:MAG: hypothetical protein ACN0LA_02325 [Candidatus Longimicrobiales bacterium M2_2A_002]
MVDFIPGMALLHLTKGTESTGSDSGARYATSGRSTPSRPRRADGRSATSPTADGDAAPGAPSPEPRAGEPRAGEHSEPVTCGFCGKPFVEDRGQATCQACPLSKGCGLMRCPHCGYENAREPGWLSRIKEWIR